MQRRPLLASLLLAPVAGACGSDALDWSGYANDPGGNPLDASLPALPFPSDFYLVTDATTATGRRVSIPAEAMPAGIDPALFAHDGFSVTPLLVTRLPGGTDLASLPSPTDPTATIADDSSVLLVREGTWERVPILAELDQTTSDPERQALLIRPLVALEFATGYVVILRDRLRNLAGVRHQADQVFVALRDGHPTDIAEIEAQRAAFTLVNEAIEATGLTRREVVFAWSFHTRSEPDATAPLLAAQRAVMTAPLGIANITSDVTDASNRQLEGTFTVPDYVDPATKTFRLDSNGDALTFGTRTVDFVATIPLSVDGPRPTLVYGHGFLGNRREGTRGSFNQMCRDHRINVVAAQFGMHEGVLAPFAGALGGLWSNLDLVVSEVQQTFVNATALARLVREQLSVAIVRDPMDGNPAFEVFDRDDVQYMGISNGGTFGWVMAASSPAVSRATIVVGGGGLVHFLQRAVNWNDFRALVEYFFPDPLEFQLVLSLMQSKLDPIDSMTYARRLVATRHPGLQPLRASLHMAVNDSQVNNLVTEWLMRSAGIPYVDPSPKTIWGVPTIRADAPAGAPITTPALYHVYDEHVSASPITNVPPATDNGTHGSVRSLAAYQLHVGRFITEGVSVHACVGPCDPD